VGSGLEAVFTPADLHPLASTRNHRT